MNKNKAANSKIDWPGTKRIRKAMQKKKLIKITINIDADSLSAIKSESEETGIPYQRILNSVLRESLKARSKTASRLEKIEKELSAIKKKLAA
jgi:uncharacterized protein (DUF4415 family)